MRTMSGKTSTPLSKRNAVANKLHATADCDALEIAYRKSAAIEKVGVAGSLIGTGVAGKFARLQRA